MENTFEWKINQLDAKISEGDLEKVVYNIHWSLIASDDSEEPVTASSIGTHSVSLEEDTDFIPYEDLTKEDVVGWLEEGMDNIESIKEGLDKQIELLKNPVDVYLTPEWE